MGILFESTQGLQVNSHLQKKNSRLFKKFFIQENWKWFVCSADFEENMWSKFIEMIQRRKHVFNEITVIDREWTHTHTYVVHRICIDHINQLVNKFLFLSISFIFIQFIVLIETAEEWNLHRRLIQPTFHVNTLEQFLGTFIDASNVLVQRFKDSASQLNITHLVNQCVIDILNGTPHNPNFHTAISLMPMYWFIFFLFSKLCTESVLGVPILTKNGINMDNSPFRQ